MYVHVKIGGNMFLLLPWVSVEEMLGNKVWFVVLNRTWPGLKSDRVSVVFTSTHHQGFGFCSIA